jgi:prefoldin subunit 5
VTARDAATDNSPEKDEAIANITTLDATITTLDAEITTLTTDITTAQTSLTAFEPIKGAA